MYKVGNTIHPKGPSESLKRWENALWMEGFQKNKALCVCRTMIPGVHTEAWGWHDGEAALTEHLLRGLYSHYLILPSTQLFREALKDLPLLLLVKWFLKQINHPQITRIHYEQNIFFLKNSYQKKSHSKDGTFQGMGVGEAMDMWKQTRALFLRGHALVLSC